MSPTGSSLPSLVIVEDEVLLLGLLADYFAGSGQFEVRGGFTSGRQAIDAICAAPPELVILDLQLPDVGGLAVVNALRERLAVVPKILVLSAGTSPLLVKQLLRAGVRGIIQKGVSAAEVMAACQRVLRGGLCLELCSPDVLDFSSEGGSAAEAALSMRETEVLEQVVVGRRSKEIAEVLGLSVRTVEKHRENIMRKLGVNDVGGLVRYALRSGLISPGVGTPAGA